MKSREERARYRAIQTRNKLGFNYFDNVDIFKVLRDRENISVITMPFTNGISGLFMKKGEIGLVIINSAKSLGHQHFTAAHEYYHILYEEGMTGRICSIKTFNDEEIEQEANSFASYFLMPDDSLRYYINERTGDNERTLNIRDVVYLEQYFSISHALMLLRLKKMGAISENESNDMRSGIIKKAQQLGYCTELYKNTINEGTKVHSNYAELAEELLEAGVITYGKYEELLIDGLYDEILFGEEAIDDECPETDYF